MKSFFGCLSVWCFPSSFARPRSSGQRELVPPDVQPPSVRHLLQDLPQLVGGGGLGLQGLLEVPEEVRGGHGPAGSLGQTTAHLLLQLVPHLPQAGRDPGLDEVHVDGSRPRVRGALLQGDLDEPGGLVHVGNLHGLGQLHLGQSLAQPDERLELPWGGGDHLGPGSGGSHSPHLHVVVHEGLSSVVRDHWLAHLLRVQDVSPEHIQGDDVGGSPAGVIVRGGVVQGDEVPGELPVGGQVGLVQDQEDQVEPGQQRRGQPQVLHDALVWVVPGPSGVGAGQDAGPRVQRTDDPSLGQRDGLLLHGLVEGIPGVVRHLVKLVDAAHTEVGQHEGSRLQNQLPRLRVPRHVGGETH
mmetsp:Transcript_9963/g.34343  ORF Transcript_9963/g.34343 Transcript_9963/m.34343 type:complete len:354 (-) Transcript_9963:2072-3133(-)